MKTVKVILPILAIIGIIILCFFLFKPIPPPEPIVVDRYEVNRTKINNKIDHINTISDIASAYNYYHSINLEIDDFAENLDFAVDSGDNNYWKDLLLKKSYYEYLKTFANQVTEYFTKPVWKKEQNDIINNIAGKLRQSNYIESGTVYHKQLGQMQQTISTYNEMQKCISKINAITNNLRNYIPVNEISNLNNQKQSLINQSCEKNKAVESELISSYENLEKQAKANARLSITPTHLEFDAAGGTKTIDINTNVTPWSHSTVFSWLSINKHGSSLTITCEPNSNAKERTDNFHVKAYEKTEQIIIKQKAKVSQTTTEQTTTGKIEKIWITQNVSQNGQKGMIIHVKFSVKGMQNKQGNCVVWFYFSDGTKLKDNNGRYKTSDGQVANREDFRPWYENHSYDDFKIFMPYDELHLKKGKHKLKLEVGVFDQNNKRIANSNYALFEIKL